MSDHPPDILQDGRYSSPARVLHWSVAILVFVQFFSIFYVLVRGQDAPLVLLMISAHHASGMSIFVLMIIRLVVRWRRHTPELPSEHFSRAQINAAKGGHTLLYILLFVMPVTGYVILDASEYNAHFLGAAMPDVLKADEETMSFAMLLHWIGAWVIGLAIAGHIGMAVYHHLKKQASIKRML